MKKIFYALMATLTGLVLLFSYRTSLGETASAEALPDTTPAPASAQRATPSPSASASESPSASASPSPSASASGSSESSGSSSAAAAPATSGLADGTYLGSAADTRFGPVQVQITVSGGTVTDVQVPVYPAANGRDQQINSRAVPILVEETLAAQSADIDMVSGATYTSRGYITSLQSALDEARA